MTSKSKTGFEPFLEGRMMHTIHRVTKDEAHALCGWAIVIGATLIGFWLSEGTAYHQLVVGLLMASASLFVSLALLETLWRAH